MVDVIVPGKEKVTYVHVHPEMVGRIVAEHIVNGRPVAKLSDASGKAMCRDDEYLEYLQRSVDFRLQREKQTRK